MAVIPEKAILEKGKIVHRFSVSVTSEIEADTAEEAALLMYQALATQPAPLRYLVAEEAVTVEVQLRRDEAEEFAAADHTADPGNW